MKFIGTLQRQDGTLVAVLSDVRGPSFGRVGETVVGRYRILKIGSESIELSYLDGQERQVIRLNGQ